MLHTVANHFSNNFSSSVPFGIFHLDFDLHITLSPSLSYTLQRILSAELCP